MCGCRKDHLFYEGTTRPFLHFLFYPNYSIFLPFLPKWKHCLGNIKSLRIRRSFQMREPLKWDYTLQKRTSLSINSRGYTYNFITLEEPAFSGQQMRSILRKCLQPLLRQAPQNCTPVLLQSFRLARGGGRVRSWFQRCHQPAGS